MCGRKPLSRILAAAMVAVVMPFVMLALPALPASPSPGQDAQAVSGYSWEVLNTGSTEYAYSIAGGGPHDLWVGGNNGLLTHYNGSAWTNDAFGAGIDFDKLFALDSDHVWATGNPDGSWAHIYFYDGGSWTDMPRAGNPLALPGLFASDYDTMYAAGGGGAPGILPCVWTWDGAKWDNLQPGFTFGGYGTCIAESSDAVWLGTSEGKIYKYTSPAGFKLELAASPYDKPILSMTSRGRHVWAVVQMDEWGNAEILHYNGSAWSRYGVIPVDFNLSVTDVYAASETDVWAAGSAGILHYDGSSWTNVTPDLPGVNSYAAYKIWACPGHVFLADFGSSGRVYHGTYAGPGSSNSFYFAEGYTGAGFDEYLCLSQPSDEPLAVKATYMFQDGSSQEEVYTVAASSRLTVNVNAAVGQDREVSIRCDASGPFVAERPMYFDYHGWTGGHDVMGTPDTSKTWYFAEGYTGDGFDEYVCVLNPGGSQAGLTFRFQTQEEGEKTVSGLSVGPHTRSTFKVNDILGNGYQASLKLESSQPVVAERPMYFDYGGGWTGGHCVMGANSLAKQYYLAEGTTREGFDEWLTLQNPNASRIEVNADYILSSGNPVNKKYTIDAGKRFTVYVPDEVDPEMDVSIYLYSDALFLAERPMYFDYGAAAGLNWTGGHCVIGTASQATDWFFAEGYTGPGFEEWLCIQNAGPEAADVTITYYPEGGSPIMKEPIGVEAQSRSTVSVNASAGEGLSLSAKVTSSRPVIIERPMYFDYNGWTGGHDVIGYMP